MNSEKYSKDFFLSAADYSSFIKSKKKLNTLTRITKFPNPKTQSKEIRRKERLKSLFQSYFGILNLTPNPEELTNSPYESSEKQITTLLNHQESYLAELSQSPRESLDFFSGLNFSSTPLCKNPLIYKIKAMLEPESKLFRPDSNNFLVKSRFFHEEGPALTHKASLSEEVNLKLMAYQSIGIINGKISKMIKVDSAYRKANEKITETLKKLKILLKKPVFSNRPPLSISRVAETPKFCLKSSRHSKAFSEESLSTSRSSSANQRRLGFFFSNM